VVLYEEGDSGFVSSNSSLALPMHCLRLVYAQIVHTAVTCNQYIESGR